MPRNLGNLHPDRPVVKPIVGETHTNPNGHTRTVLEIVGDSVIFQHLLPGKTKPTIGSCRIVNWGRWLRGEKVR